MGDTAKALGIGPTLTHKGKTYRLSPLSFEGQALYEVWLEGRAWEVASRSNRFMSGAAAENVAAQVSRDIAAGVYSTGSPTWRASTQSIIGIKRMLFLMLLKEHPDIDEPTVDELFTHLMAEVVAKINEANAIPNLVAPAGPGAEAVAAAAAQEVLGITPTA